MLRWRKASYTHTAVATDTFKLSTDGVEATFREKVERLETNVDALTDGQTAPDDTLNDSIETDALTPEKIQILSALVSTKYALRSFSGILGETGIEAEQLRRLLDELVAVGLVATAVGKKNNVLWTLRPEGRKAYEEIK